MQTSDFIEELWAGGPKFRQAEHFRLSTDSVLLADFVNLLSSKKGIDLGCASGIIGLLLLTRSEKLHMTGIELLEDASCLARENMTLNSLSARSDIICGDLRQHRTLFQAGSFDLVTSNPPYFPEGTGVVSSDPGRAGARSELHCTLDDICTAAAFLLRTGGTFAIVHKPERLSELFCSMNAHKIEPKRLRMVQLCEGRAPSLVLVEGKRGGKPGLKIEAPLILSNSDGSESSEYKRIYHR